VAGLQETGARSSARRVPQSRRFGQGPRGLYIIKDAEERGLFARGGVIVEGTAEYRESGLALVGNAPAIAPSCHARDPEPEKKDMLLLCGVDLRLVPAVPYANPNNYVRYSGRLAEEIASRNPMAAIWATSSTTSPTGAPLRDDRAGDLEEKLPARSMASRARSGSAARFPVWGSRSRSVSRRQDLSLRLHGLGHLQLVRRAASSSRGQLDHRSIGNTRKPRT